MCVLALVCCKYVWDTLCTVLTHVLLIPFWFSICSYSSIWVPLFLNLSAFFLNLCSVPFPFESRFLSIWVPFFLNLLPVLVHFGLLLLMIIFCCHFSPVSVLLLLRIVLIVNHMWLKAGKTYFDYSPFQVYRISMDQTELSKAYAIGLFFMTVVCEI